MEIKKITIFYGHVAGNIGDLAINVGEKELLKTVFPEASIRFVLLDNTQSQFLDSSKNSLSGKEQEEIFHLTTSAGLVTKYFDSPESFLVDTDSMDSDLIVIAAGEHLFSYDHGENEKSLFWRTLPAFSAKCCNKTSILMPSTLGPFETKESKLLASDFLNSLSLYAARDKESIDVLNSLINSSNHKLLLDPAFFIKPVFEARESKIKTVGFSVRSEGWGIRLASKKRTKITNEFKKNNQTDSIAFQSARDIACEFIAAGWKVQIFIQTFADEQLSEELYKSLLHYNVNAEVELVRPATVTGYIQYLSRLDFIVTSRFHAVILSSLVDVPAAGLFFSIHGHKMPGMHHMLGVSNRCINLDEYHKETVCRKVLNLANSENNSEVAVRIEHLKNETLEWLRSVQKTKKIVKLNNLDGYRSLGFYAIENIKALLTTEMEQKVSKLEYSLRRYEKEIESVKSNSAEKLEKVKEEYVEKNNELIILNEKLTLEKESLIEKLTSFKDASVVNYANLNQNFLSLKTDFDEIENELKSTRLENKNLEAELNKKEINERSLFEKNNSLLQQLNENKVESKQTDNKILDLHETIKNNNIYISDLEKECESMKSDIADFNMQLKEKSEALLLVTASYKSQLENKNVEIDDLKKAYEQLDIDLKDNIEKSTLISKKYADEVDLLVKSSESKDQKIIELNAVNEKNNQSLSALKSSYNRLATELDSLKSTLQKQKEEFESKFILLNNEISNYECRTKELDDVIAVNNKDISNFKNGLEEALYENNVFKSKLESLSCENSYLSNIESCMSDELALLNTCLTDMKKAMFNSISDYNCLKSECDVLKNKLSDCSNKLDNSLAINESLTALNESLNSKLSTFESEISEIINSSNAKIEDRENKIIQLEIECRNLISINNNFNELSDFKNRRLNFDANAELNFLKFENLNFKKNERKLVELNDNHNKLNIELRDNVENLQMLLDFLNETLISISSQSIDEAVSVITVDFDLVTKFLASEVINEQQKEFAFNFILNMIDTKESLDGDIFCINYTEYLAKSSLYDIALFVSKIGENKYKSVSSKFNLAKSYYRVLDIKNSARVFRQISRTNAVLTKDIKLWSKNVLDFEYMQEHYFDFQFPIDPIVDKIENKVVCIMHSCLPYLSGGYATRAHGVLSAISNYGIDIKPYARPNFPYDAVKNKHQLPEVESVTVDNIIYNLTKSDVNRSDRTEASYMRKSITKYEEIFRRERPSLVHGRSTYLISLPALIAAKRCGIPFVYEVSGLWEIVFESDPALSAAAAEKCTRIRYYETLAATHADSILTLTQAMKDEIVSRGVAANKIMLAPNCVNPEKFTPIPRDLALCEQYHISENTVVIGYVGSFQEYEGLDDLISACELIAERQPALDFKLLLVGDGPCFPRISQLVQDSSIYEKIIVTGRVSHDLAKKYYSIIDIAPFPRKSWPVCEMVSPMKPLEALAMEKTVVVSSVLALAEMVVENETGLIFEKGNVDSLANILSIAMLSPEQRKILGRKARKWVETNRNWSSVGEIFIDCYKKVLPEK